MTARKKIVTSYAWEQFQGRPTFGEAEIDSIILEVGKLPEGKIKVKDWDADTDRNVSLIVERRDWLASRLDTAVALIAHHDILNSKQTMSDTDKRLRAIRAATGELLKKLARADATEAQSYLENSIRNFYQTSDKNKEALNLFGQLRPMGQEIFAGDILAKFVHAIGLLGDITEIAIQENTKRKATGKAGKNAPHKTDMALEKCIAFLGRIYRQIWKKPSAGLARYANGGGAYRSIHLYSASFKLRTSCRKQTSTKSTLSATDGYAATLFLRVLAFGKMPGKDD
jgi:hypothetical protein